MEVHCAVCKEKIFSIERYLQGYYKCGNCRSELCFKCGPKMIHKYNKSTNCLRDNYGRCNKCDKCYIKK